MSKKTKRRPQPPPKDPMLAGVPPAVQHHAVDRSRQHARLDVITNSPEVRQLVDLFAAHYNNSHPLNSATEGGHAPGHHSTPPPGYVVDRTSTTVQWEWVRKQAARWSVQLLERGLDSTPVSQRRKVRCAGCGKPRSLRWHRHCPDCGTAYPSVEAVAS